MFLILKIYRRIMRVLRLDSVLGELDTWLTISIRYGHLKSALLRRPSGPKGELIPWYSYAAIDYLNNFDFRELSVLEYGGGNSSFWWADRCKQLTTVESEKDWYKVLVSLAQGRPGLDFQLQTTKNSYLEVINSLQPNIIVIDGLYRSECATQILNLMPAQLENLQMVIFDNSNWFPSAISRLTNGLVGFQRVDFCGLGPIVSFPTSTSLFFKTVNSTLVIKDRQITPMGAPSFTHPEDF